MVTLKDKAAIVGAGETTYSRNSGVSDLALVLQASLRAIEDAGISPKDIDGIITGYGDLHAKSLMSNFGSEDIKYAVTINMGGASAVASIQSATVAIATGIATNILCVAGWNGCSGGKIATHMHKPGIGLSMIANFEMPYGASAPALWYALMAKRHMHEYGTTSRQFGAVAVTMRKHAQLNDNAIMRNKPMTIEDHQNSRMIAEPIRLLDCCLESDGAAAVVITSAERARNMRHQPVYIMGVAEGHPDSPEQITNRLTLTELGIKKAAPRAFTMAGISPKDIDVAEVYDCFTYIVICQLEDIGFCNKGEGGPFVEGGRIEIGGELPVNTHGGLLSQAHVLGMNHMIEAVKQLWGSAGKAQVKDAEIALVSGYGDQGDGTLAILRR